MVDVGEPAPDFTAPIVDGDVSPFTLSNHLDESPLVLAFFPAAFTGTCTTELCTFDERLSRFEDVGATVYGVSVDTPFSLEEYRRQEGLGFGLVSDHDKEIVDAYGIRDDFDDLGFYGLAKRAVFVVDDDGVVAWKWVADDPGQEPDYEAVEDAATEAA